MLTLPVTTVEARDTVIYRSYVADVQAVRNVELRARVPGFLEKIYVDEGQPVKHRQRLFKISEEEYAAELAKAKANLQSAIAQAKASQLEVDRLRVLVDKNVLAASELEVALAKLDAVRSRIEEARSAEVNATMRLSLHQHPRPLRRHHRPHSPEDRQPDRSRHPADHRLRRELGLRLLQRVGRRVFGVREEQGR